MLHERFYKGQKNVDLPLNEMADNIDRNRTILDDTRIGENNTIGSFDEGGLSTETAEASTEEWSLQHSKPANNSCKITAGCITLAGKDYEFTVDTVTLTGATEFVYVQVEYSDTDSATLGHASAKPVSNSTYFYLVLVSFTATDGVWDSGIIRWKGDYNGAQPII